ncbi:hypothetical protein ACSBR1_014418 [Camellia fascicularis]
MKLLNVHILKAPWRGQIFLKDTVSNIGLDQNIVQEINQERLEDIERDQREYTLDDEDRKVQDVILKQDPSKNDTMWLKKTLSCSYPNFPFNEALQKENEKLQLELQQAVAVNSVSEKSSPTRISKKVEQNYSDVNSEKEHSYDESYTKQSETHSTSRNTSSVSSGRDLLSTRGSNWDDEWHLDLFGCCSEPILYINLKSVSFSMFYLSRAERCKDSLLVGFNVCRGQLAQEVYENIGREASCLRIQRDFRMHLARKAYKELCSFVVSSQAGMRGMVARNELCFRRQIAFYGKLSLLYTLRLLDYMNCAFGCISRNFNNFFYTSFCSTEFFKITIL